MARARAPDEVAGHSAETMPRSDLYPDIAPYESGYLPLDSGHTMYWEQVGSPSGMPARNLTEIGEIS